MELIRAAEILIEKIKKDYKDDIAAVIIMGSYIYNDTHSKSDLDLFFVPKTERGYNLGITFVIDDIGFDFWLISWERLERIACFEEKTTSIITEGKVLYCASEADMERLNILKNKASDVSDRYKFIEKAKEKLNGAYKDYFKLCNAQTVSDAGIYAIGIIYTVTYAIALLNGITVKRGRGKLKREILNMPLIPDNFSELYDTAFTVRDIGTLRDTYSKLINNTESLILREQKKYSKSLPFSDALYGFYEESINFYNKIYHACETGDKVTAFFASAELTCEIESVFKGTDVSPKMLPDIISAYDPENLSELKSAARSHQMKFVELLTAKGVNIRQFKNFNEFEKFFNSL
jgi:hypothetical protein